MKIATTPPSPPTPSAMLVGGGGARRADPARRALLADVVAERDRVDKVTRFAPPPPLVDLGGLGGDTAVGRVVTEGTEVYVLDVGGARLLRYQLQADGSLQKPDPD